MGHGELPWIAFSLAKRSKTMRRAQRAVNSMLDPERALLLGEIAC